jgi:hypothetical protein
MARMTRCFLPAIAYITLFLSSIYIILSTVALLKRWDVSLPDNLNQSDQGPPIVSTNFNITTNSTERIFSDNQISYLLVQTLKTHFSQISLNATTRANDDTTNNLLLQDERLHILEVLINYYSKPSRPIHSDVVELRHCQLDKVDYSKFVSWAAIILQDAFPILEKKLKRDMDEVQGIRKDGWDIGMYLEFCLSLLEIYATHTDTRDGTTDKICNFEKYSLQIAHNDDDILSMAEKTLRNVPASHNGLPRLVFVIVAFQDADHLEVLIEACSMPHHFIIVHLERRSPQSFTDRVHRIANKYSNVVVVQFGSIIYSTDSVSTVNYQIMNWLTEELKLPYDYLLTLGNAAYPLLSTEEMTRYFQKTKRNIWLGELRNSKNGGGWYFSYEYLERKRLIFTSGERKYTQRTKKWKQNDFVSSIPDYIKTNMTSNKTKTNSGNQAVFSYKVVNKLVNSPQVKELFAIAKWGCCCCLGKWLITFFVGSIY